MAETTSPLRNNLGQALKRGPKSTKKKIPEIPADVQAEVLGRFYDEHYITGWTSRSRLSATAPRGMRRS